MKRMVLFLATMWVCFIQAQTSEILPRIGNVSDSSIVFKISPNPATDKITVKYEILKEFNSGEFIISDLMGKTIAEQKIDQNPGTLEIPVSEFLRGIYFCRLKADNDVKTTKLIVK